MSAAAELKPCVFAALVMEGMLSAAAYQFVGERPRGNTRPVAAAMTDMAAGEIRLTSTEMHALRIEPVLEREFRTERLIEGRIAYDEEGVTPVFSPYGRARVLRIGGKLCQMRRPYGLVTMRVSQIINTPRSVSSRINRPAPCFNVITACGT